ncbi:hypothetical protein SAMN02910356_00243 [Selenomonas sp. GACV-9]|nr:hypothetical protein SAMN02910356_00243 [Selenomonas ruminantium]
MVIVTPLFMQGGTFLDNQAHHPGGWARGFRMEPLLNGAARGTEQALTVPWGNPPELTHEFHGFVGAGDAVELDCLFEFLNVDVKTGLALEPVGNVLTGNLGHEWHFLSCFAFHMFYIRRLGRESSYFSFACRQNGVFMVI